MNKKIIFGVNQVASRNLSDLVRTTKFLEEQKFDRIWFADIGFARDNIVTVCNILSNTRRIEVGPGVINPYTRHPLTIGITMATLGDIAPNRVVMAIGSGDRHIFGLFGIEMKMPIATVREAVIIIRQLLENKEVNFDGRIFKVKGAKLYFENKSKIPIYIAGKGKKMIQLAGEVGDGAYLDAMPIELMPYVHELLQKGAAKSKKGKLDDFTIANVIPLSIDEDIDVAYENVKSLVVYAAASIHKYQAEILKLDADVLTNIKNAFPNIKKASEYVTEEIIQYFTISGTPEDCIKKIKSYIEKGVSEFTFLIPSGINFEKSIRIVRENLIESYKEL
ncbi:MAG: hypothetical protein DRO67_05620 [Candidatus Asgardarchaeum californiense]|nr:MAG: hypothetical protein DRO67_05620 [Candidatus Asgardarchaeum californiense]